MSSKEGYFSTYQSPNIVIDPNKSLVYPPNKKMKIDNQKVNNNLKMLQDNKMTKCYKKMDSNHVKKDKEENLNKPIKNDSSTNKMVSCNGINKSNNIVIEKDNSSKIKIGENNSQTNNLVPQGTSGIKTNIKNIVINDEKKARNNCLLSSTIKTELNNNFDKNINAPNKANCSKELSSKLNNETNKKTDKNKENADIHKVSNKSNSNVKNIKEEPSPKKIKEETKKNKQVHRKYATKVTKHGKNKKEPPKKIKIIINVTYNDLRGKDNIKPTNTNDGDLSFLDDFDVDEVVESLFYGKEQNSPIIKTNIDIDEKIIDNSKKRKTSNKEEINTNHKESCLKPNSSVENKIEVNKKTSNKKEKPPAGVATENKGNNIDKQIDCNIPKNLKSDSTSSKITTEDKKEEIKKEASLEEVKCIDSDENLNINNKNNGQILNKFVTKSDKDLAHNLEMRMYDTLKQKYSILAVTHYGRFSKIFKCIDTSGDYYAVKILDNPASNHIKGKKKENILKELKKDIPGENLRCINLLHSFEIDKHMCYMTNYYSINLEQVLNKKKFHIEEIQILAKQLVEAITVLRNKNIIHHDIKPSHILLDSKAEKLLLCGFDEAIYHIYADNSKTNIGTVNYASPEKILGHSHSFPIDVWSTALVIYEMATNTMLFKGTTDNEVLFKQMSVLGNIPENIIKVSRFKNVHFRGTTFIKKGLNQYSDVRIHNFVKNNNMYSSIIEAQSTQESHIGTEKKNTEKVQSLIRLLGKMLIIDPSKRLTIEYVYADNFFFDKPI